MAAAGRSSHRVGAPSSPIDQKTGQEALEESVLGKPYWCEYREQLSSEAIHHTESENIEARDRMSRVVEGGFGCDPNYLLRLYKQK